MKKSLSLVVAIALVFSLLTPAMAFAATSQEIAAGAKLKEYGVLTGNTQGDLLLDLELDREDMIVLLSRLMGVEEEAAATENTHGWDDVTDPFYHGYISWAKNEGLTKGVGDGSKFGYDQKMTVQELLQFQLRALGYEVEWNDVPAKAVELGLVAEGEDMAVNATRGKMAVVTLQALNTPVNGENILLGAKLGIEDFIPDVGILSFNAVGAKKLQVKFASAVDTEEAKITVKRGVVTVNVSDIKWSDNNTVATIETASRLVEGTYTVSVEGVAEEALTASVDVDNEKVESIEITSDVAPMARKNDGTDNPEQVVVNYVVKNQYGEDVSNLYVPTATASGKVDENANGVLKISKNNGEFVIQETVFVSLVYIGQGYTVSAQKTLNVGLSGKADTVEVTGIYNEDPDAVLDSDVSGDEAGNFKLLLDVKDQYGNPIKDINILKQDLFVHVGGTHILEVQYEEDNGKNTDVPAFELVEVDGVKVPALPLKEVKAAGTAVVNVVPKYSGKSANYTVVVEEGLVYDQVILSPVSGIVAAGEDVYVPVTVLDTKGNSVTDTKKLNDALNTPNSMGTDKIRINVSNNNTVEFVTKDGNLFLKFSVDNQGTVSVNATTESFKYSYLTIDVKPAAKPRAIIGLKADTNRLIFQGAEITLNHENVLVEDNYGRVMDKDTLKKALEKALESNPENSFRIQLSGHEDNDKVTVVSDVYDIKADYDQDGNVVISGIKLKATNKGNQTLTLTLHDDAITDSNNPEKVVRGSQWQGVFRTVTLEEIRSIAIDDVDVLYAGREDAADGRSEYSREVKVTATTKDGKKVSIPAGDFSLSTLSAYVHADNGGKKVYITNPAILSKDQKETTVVIRAVLENGITAEREVKVTNAAPKVDSVEIKDLTDGTLEIDAGVLNGANLISVLTLEVKDQYGVEAKLASGEFADGSKLPTASVTVSDINKVEDSGLKVTNNGRNDAVVSGAKAGDEFTVKVQFGSVSAKAKVKVK